MIRDFTQKVLSAAEQYKMFDSVSTVTVALSGGADSMSLLYFLKTHAKELGITVNAAHLNHSLRGEEALRDESFVREQCEKAGVKLFVRRVDIALLAKERRIGQEECGRSERYAFFEQLRRENPGSVTATAHTASDNAETILLNITRGCGLTGLCGIPPVRDGIIRPLISVTRSEIEEYCSENAIPFVTDSTNLHDNYSRNRIRLNVLPQLKEINPSAEAAINRLSALARSDAEFISDACDKELKQCEENGALSAKKLMQCDSRLLPHVLRKYIDKYLDITPEKKHLDLIFTMLKNDSGAVELERNKFVEVNGGFLIAYEKKDDLTENVQKFTEVFFSPGKKYSYLGKYVIISEKKRLNLEDKRKINKKLLINAISCGIISCDTIIRTRQSGDTFSPYGRNCTKTVKKLFTEMKIPISERDTRLLIANGSKVLWIEGIGTSQDAAVKNDGEAFYEITTGCEDNDEGCSKDSDR